MLLFAAYKEASIAAMELPVAEEKFDAIDYAVVHTYAIRHGITLWSCRLPAGLVSGIDLSDDALAERILSTMSRSYKRRRPSASALSWCIPAWSPLRRMTAPPDGVRKKDTGGAGGYRAAAYDRVIAVENLPRSCCLGCTTAEMEELLSAHPALRVCFDTNHLFTDAPVTFIQRLGDKIVTTHVSDYDLINERHWLPGEGKPITVLGRQKENLGYWD